MQKGIQMGFFDIFRISEIKAENEQLKQRLAALGCDEYEEVQRKIAEAKKEFSNLNEEMADQNTMISSPARRNLSITGKAGKNR